MESLCPRCGRPTLPDGRFCRFCGSNIAGAALIVPVIMTEAEEIRRGTARRRAIPDDDYSTDGHDSALAGVLGSLLAVAVCLIFYLLYQARGTHFVFTFR